MKKKVIVCSFLFITSFLIGIVIYLSMIFAGNYVIDNKKLVMDSATSLIDKNGELITKLYIENREIITISEVPDHVKQAFVAIEDARFYEHQGIDFRAIGRALYRDMIARSKVEGGSTITQQLVKNTFLTNEKTWLRKTKEVLIAINLERRYSKDKLLEMYLNQSYFGHGAYGIQTAAKLFFSKGVSELTVDEGAMLAGLLRAPSSYSPIHHPERNKQRRDLVLTVMEQRGYLSAEEVVRYHGRTISVDLNKITQNPAFLTYVDMVLEEAESKYHLSLNEVLTGGYQIVVPMDIDVQKISYDLFQEDYYFPSPTSETAVEGAFVLFDGETGGVKAVQGGREYASKGLNRVQVKRQPGSAFKPLAVYLPALESGTFQPYSLLKDEPLIYDGYQPRNYTNRYEGELTMYDAITMSANAPAVWLLNEVGIDSAKKTVRELDISFPDDGLAIALGGLKNGVTPLELAKAYRPFAKEGRVVEPYFIEKIYDRHGQLIGESKVSERTVFSAQTAWFMTRMLESVVTEGTAKQGDVDFALAGKTGTTSFPAVQGGVRDAWFVGYTPNVVGALWMGYDITNEKQYLTGGSEYATTLFKEILNQSIAEEIPSSFVKPANIRELEPPIRYIEIDDLKASSHGLFHVKLTWGPSKDKRLKYRIYEVTEAGLLEVGSTTGKGEFILDKINIFSPREYVVVPYNVQTNREGSPSNSVQVALFHRDSANEN
ncbi:transglycosylase domain-containing protein [Anaerobacillus sp. MEB173]|uniref:transglycosylase domain-containing protein n=1 Tax=Anaerobacillus sp. MEB173 TaxID=3383345 RepID=UPI003F910F95